MKLKDQCEVCHKPITEKEAKDNANMCDRCEKEPSPTKTGNCSGIAVRIMQGEYEGEYETDIIEMLNGFMDFYCECCCNGYEGVI